jgi:hypothetical protein
MRQVTEQDFAKLLKDRLDDSWERGLALFQACGPNLTFDVTNVLLHAVDKNKVNEVLTQLEEHEKTHLRFQHPEIRGHVNNVFGSNPTTALFLSICKDTLGLKPNGQ